MVISSYNGRRYIGLLLVYSIVFILKFTQQLRHRTYNQSVKVSACEGIDYTKPTVYNLKSIANNEVSRLANEEILPSEAHVALRFAKKTIDIGPNWLENVNWISFFLPHRLTSDHGF